MTGATDHIPMAQTASERALAELLVRALNLDIVPGEIDPSAPLFGNGLGLDSIDMLETALAVSKQYGVELQSEDREAMATLRSLALHIEAHRIR